MEDNRLANNNDGQIVLGLNIPKTVEQINADIKKLQNQLAHIKATGKLDTDATVQQINTQIAELQKQLANINIKANIDTGNIAKETSREAQKIGQQIETQITNNVSQGFTEGLKSFSELKVGEDTKFGIIFDKNGLIDAENTLKEIKETYSEFGQVKITNEIFNSGELEKFKVNIQQVNGDLKETRSFMMSKSNDGQSFIPTNDIIKGSESIVHHLDEAKNATNKIVTEEEKLAEQMSKVREKTELARRAEEKRQELAQNNAINKALEKEYAEREKIAEQANKIIKDTGDKGNTTTSIALLRDGFTKLGLSADDVKNKMAGVDKEFSLLKDAIATDDNNAIVSQFNKVNAVLSQTQNDLKVTRSEYSQLVSAQQRLAKANTIEEWNQRNSKATSAVRTANEAYIISLRDLNSQMTKMQFNEIVNGFKRAENSMRGINRLGANIKDQFKQAFQTIAQTMSVVNVVRTGMNYVQQMPSIVTELDTSLVDLAKTADMSADELKDFYYASNDVAKQMGVTTNEILTQASAWSRLGFSTAEQATQMAKYSSMFKMISPGMDINTSTDGLVSIMKAFKIGLDDVDDVVDGIMSKVNIIGNTRAVDNSDIITFLTRSSAAMAEANNTLEDTIALGTAMTEITRDASNAGQVLKTVSMRIRGYDEETGELIEGVEELRGKIADLTKTAATPGGISLFTDEAKIEYKSTRQILQDISEIYDQLTDKKQAELLEVLAGKRNGQAVAAILNNFDAVTNSLDSMSNSAGNAEAEMSIMADSVSYKLNRLQETGTGIAQNLFDRDDMKNVLDFFNSLAEVLDFATDKLGLFGTIGVGTGIAASIKNVGRDKM